MIPRGMGHEEDGMTTTERRVYGALLVFGGFVGGWLAAGGGCWLIC